MAIQKNHLDTIEIDALLSYRSALSRRAIFAELASVYCFTCGATRGIDGDCPCLIDRRGELNEQQDKI